MKTCVCLLGADCYLESFFLTKDRCICSRACSIVLLRESDWDFLRGCSGCHNVLTESCLRLCARWEMRVCASLG